jgi:hypothetical protein
VSDITLPREVVEKIREAWSSEVYPPAASIEWYDIMDALRAALTAALAEPEPEPVHPGYIIGSHWLETAYSRIAAGEVEAEVLTEVLGARGWVKPEPATREQVFAAYDRNDAIGFWNYCYAWREAERFHGITKGDKT